MERKKGSIISGIFWMFLISILLFWLPGIGPFIAGIVGGKKSGGLFNAIIAVFLPAIVLGAFLFLFTSVLTGAPVIGFVAGAGSFVLVVSNVGPLLLGAIIGGLLN
ncbi:MAG: hypothetical protein AAF462_06075 [Thermodesulfobacteriota bacterium]